MVTKEKLDVLVQETKSLKERTEAAESKAVALEEEKKSWEAEKAEAIASKGSAIYGNKTTSDENRCLRHFQVRHPKQLLDVNVGAKKFKHVPEEFKGMVLSLKESVDIGRWMGQMFQGAGQDMIGSDSDRAGNVKGVFETRYGKEVLEPMTKAFGTGVAGGGQEWVPTAISSRYIEEFELERKVEGRFTKIACPTNPYQLPKAKDVTRARIVAEGAQMTEANFATDKIEFSATKLAEYFILPEELNEDSAPDMMALARDEIVQAQERAAEYAIINGDSDGTHIDSDSQAGGADLAEKAWDGLRKIALANAGASLDVAGGITEAGLRSLRALMLKFGSDPKQLMWLVGPSVYTQMLALPSVSTIDKFGSFATVLNGAMAAYQGIPIINSEHLREDLNASGVYDGVTTNLGSIVLANVSRFFIGERRPIKVKLMQDLPSYDRWLLASYRRLDFEGHAQSATEKSAVYGYNVAL